MMKRSSVFLTGCLLAGCLHAEVSVKQVDLTGTIRENELALKMAFAAQVDQVPASIPVLSGDVLPTDVKLPKGVELLKNDGAYTLEFSRKGAHEIEVNFEAKVWAVGQKRRAAFSVPSATIRKMTLQTDEEGCTVEVPGAPLVQRLDATTVQTFLPATGDIQVEWRPELEKLSGDLVASCDSILIGSAKVGALQLQGRYLYTIPQGRMKELSMKLPQGLNIIQVSGADLLAWDVQELDGVRQLSVELSRPHEKSYELTVTAEQPLPDFPCSFSFPVMEPQAVLRANGVVLVGTDSTIKLLVDELSGVTQVEPDAVNWGMLPRPKRGLYAYMFANMPFGLKLSADNIVTALHAQDEMVLALSENDVSLDVKVDLEVRDAPARDVEFEISKDWTAADVSGQNVADYDVRDRDGSRWIRIYFKKETEDRSLIQVRLERTLEEGAKDFALPVFRVAGARSERGFLVLRSETGTRLEGADLKELREVNTGSLPVRIADARQAYRFKNSDWSGRARIFQEQASMHAESFQLVSLGESGVFGSCLITYNIANAPIRSFELQVPEEYRNVEIHGRDIRNWAQNGGRWTVHLQQKVIGDYTLLVTYDHPAQYQGETLRVGGIQTLNAESETGYIALAGAANLSLGEEVEVSPTILSIDADEVPEEYALLVNDPVMHAYKYVAAPHEATVKIKRFATQPLLTQVADHITLSTKLSAEGEAVTTVIYHVKNTDQQYLPIRLPETASLWSVRVDDNKTQVLDQGDGQMLIPVERRRNPNAPLRVEVTYAEQLNRPGMFSHVRFQSPKIDAQSVFARWTFKLPNGKRILSAKGNMELPGELSGRRVGWGRLAANIFGPGGVQWLFMCGFLAGGLFLLGWVNGIGKSKSFLFAILIGVVLLAAFAGTALLIGAAGALAGGSGHTPAEWVFSKAVSGSADRLSVSLSLVNSGFETVKNFLLLLGGAVPVIWLLVTGRRRWVYPALAVLACVYSFSPHLAWSTVLVPHLLLFAACYKTGFGKGDSRRAFQKSKQEVRFQEAPLTTGKDGYVRHQLLGLVSVVALAVIGCASVLPPVEEEPVALKADQVELQVGIPEFETESAVNVKVHMDVKLSAEKGDTLQLLGPGSVLTGYDLSSRSLSISVDPAGSFLSVDRDGDYSLSLDCIVSASCTNGVWIADLWIPDALENRTTVELPDTDWTLKSPQAIRVRQTDTSADILFSPNVRQCALLWTPKERKTDLEQARFFCDINTLADCRPGMVSLQHFVKLNIAQGELQSFRFDVPEGMSVTEVHGKDIATWRYDPATGLVEIVLSSPVSESCQLVIGAQVIRKKLPYEAVVQGIGVRDAVMQRGVVAIASSDAVQVDVLSTDGLSSINSADAIGLVGGADTSAIRRSFRYNQMPFSASVSAAQVLPELRLAEESTLDLAVEQVRLSSRLNVTVSKAGIFALRIAVPEGFDVDSLSGDAISHWDETGGAEKEVVVNFTRQITGTVSLNLGLSRSGRDLSPEFSVPRIRMDGVLKHTGNLVITAERGIRITPEARDGVSEISPRELGVRMEGSLAYRLLRPDWSIQLQSEVMAPKLKAEVLQRVALSEGLLKVRNYLQYEIEHAGVKTFRVQAPNPDIALVVSGRNISRVRKLDDAVWEVELHGKVDTRYGMEVSYQLPVAHDQSELVLKPLKTLGTESQKGFVAVLSGGRLQVTPGDVPDALRAEDARSIPRSFGAGDLSDAVLCYRATDRDFALPLNVVRHDAADLLPAQVLSVQLDSVMTLEDQTLNSLVMKLAPGSLRFLEMTLPGESEIWSVFVNETAVRPLVEEGRYLIPIESGADFITTVEVMYAQAGNKTLFGNKHHFSGPQFKLPLTDVQWTIFAPDSCRYSRFSGTLQHQQASTSWGISKRSFNEMEYFDYNSSAAQRFGESAKENILKGNQYMKSGDQRSARKAFQKAISYSQGQQSLNEDARVQFRNLVRQQGVVGLVNRRNQLRQSLNQLDENAQIPVKNEQWSGADVRKIEAQLGEKESSALSELAEKMLDQQQAASVEVHPIRVVMARQGTELKFTRALQLQPDAEMEVEFHSAKATGNRKAHIMAIAVSSGMILLFGLLRTIRNKRD